MEAISLAFQLVDGVRAVLAALKGETKIVLTCRQLLHSTQLYAECLQSVKEVWNDSTKTSSSPQVKTSLTNISNLVSNDVELLRKIKVEVDEIYKTHNSKSLISNTLISSWTGRIEKIHRMESELMSRFQVITAIMMKDVFKSNNCLDEATMQMIGDVDGSVFWHSNFGQNKTTTFKLFVDAYQDYIAKTLFFRRLARNHLITLLKATLLDGPTTGDMSNTEISVAQFAQWLRRFGPLRETLSKASAVSTPSSEQTASWFVKELNRDQATALVEHNFRRFGSSVLPHHLIVLRYSSDPKNHFVVTCRHLGSSKMEHFPTVNAGQGYCILGDEEHAYPNLVEFIQKAIVDRLYAAAIGGSYTFPRDSLDEWEAIFGQAAAPLPEGHYGNRNALEKAATEMTPFDRNEQSGGELSISYGFATLFSGGATPPPPPPSAVFNTYSSTSTSSSTSSGPVNENKIIGKYMVRQGLDLLLSSGEVKASDVAPLLALVDRL